MQVDQVDGQIKEFIVKQFPLARNRGLQPDDDLLVNGIMDSLGVLDLVTYLEQAFGIQVSDEDLVPDNFNTIERIGTFVREKKASATA